jgi:hypothetical protein
VARFGRSYPVPRQVIKRPPVIGAYVVRTAVDTWGWSSASARSAQVFARPFGETWSWSSTHSRSAQVLPRGTGDTWGWTSAGARKVSFTRAAPASWDNLLASYAPVGWWKGNESSGTTNYDSGSGNVTVTDLYGVNSYSNAGPIKTNPSETAMSFAAGTENGNLGSDYTPGDFGTSSFSIGMWVKFVSGNPASGSWRGVAHFGSAGYKIVMGSSYFTDQISDGTNVFYVSSPAVPNDGNWHFTLLSVNTVTQTATAFLDTGLSGIPVSITGLGSVSNTAGIVTMADDSSRLFFRPPSPKHSSLLFTLLQLGPTRGGGRQVLPGALKSLLV